MIGFYTMSLAERLLIRISRRHRHAYERQLRDDIASLVRDPTLPLIIDGVIVNPPNPSESSAPAPAG